MAVVAALTGTGALLPCVRRHSSFWLPTLSWAASLCFFTAGLVMVIVDPHKVGPHGVHGLGLACRVVLGLVPWGTLCMLGSGR